MHDLETVQVCNISKIITKIKDKVEILIKIKFQRNTHTSFLCKLMSDIEEVSNYDVSLKLVFDVKNVVKAKMSAQNCFSTSIMVPE